MTSSIHSKAEIIAELELQYRTLIDWLEAQADNKFDYRWQEDKWSVGQHVEHLIKSTQPLNRALRLPKFTLKGMFGKKNERPERSFAAMVERYQEKLAAGGAATDRFLPKDVSNEEKAPLIDTLQKELEKLKKIILKWKEEDMSVYLLPHPLLGKITIREMLFFTIYHTLHHYRQLAEHYA